MAHSNNGVVSSTPVDDESETKYKKHERRRRKHVQQICYLVAALAILLFVVVMFSTTTTNSTPIVISPPPPQEGLPLLQHTDPEKLQELRRSQFLFNMKKHLALPKSPKPNDFSQKLSKFQQQEQQQQHEPLSKSWNGQIRDTLRERLQGPKDSIVQAWEQAKAGLLSTTEKSSFRLELEKLEEDIRTNRHGGIRWLRPQLLIPLPGGTATPRRALRPGEAPQNLRGRERVSDYFYVERANRERMEWETEWDKLMTQPDNVRGPNVDYTKHSYQYPPLLSEPPRDGGYPKMDTMGNVMRRWPQDDVDHPPTPFVEALLHFNFSNPQELEMARKFRDMEIPFKLYDIPELEAARVKWTDEYVSSNFDQHRQPQKRRQGRKQKEVDTESKEPLPPPAFGNAQESPSNFFAFFVPEHWKVEKMGLPPVRNNDWSFETWSKHSRYADHVRLDPDQPHFYYQAGVDREERHRPKETWTFISRDLPSLSSPTETFFVFHPNEQKGIQCRFGERGVTAATHYDSGRNMVAMITGAKRYFLSPPRECSKLAIDTDRRSSIYRHSLLNYGHINLLHDDPELSTGMSAEERVWLERASTAETIDTVLKAGEILYIPSHWFHYITSLQKSAQCNVRSGIDQGGSREFGGLEDVLRCT